MYHENVNIPDFSKQYDFKTSIFIISAIMNRTPSILSTDVISMSKSYKDFSAQLYGSQIDDKCEILFKYLKTANRHQLLLTNRPKQYPTVHNNNFIFFEIV